MDEKRTPGGQSVTAAVYADRARGWAIALEEEEAAKRALLAERRLSIATEALEIIAGKRQCLDNLMGSRDVAEDALRRIAASSHGGEP